MKNRNLNMLVKASVLSNKLAISFFSCFVMLETILVLISLGIIIPLKSNIENNVNNHIVCRELDAKFNENQSNDEIEESIAKIKSLEHVVDMYPLPEQIIATEESGSLFSEYKLSYVHNGFDLKITSGRGFEENETGVALVPDKISDFNESKHIINEVSGSDFIGKTLEFADEFQNLHKLKIVGAYNASDPIFQSGEVLIPQKELLEFDKLLFKTSNGRNISSSFGRSYKILIDNVSNVDFIKNEVTYYCNAFQEPLNFDVQLYNIALYILLGALLLFIVLAIIGLYLFVKESTDNKTNELALYRSLGYKSTHIFYILFSEYMVFGFISVVLGSFITVAVEHFFVNPYLYSLVGNSIMEIKTSVNIFDVVAILLFFIAVLFVVCRKAVRRSEYIDLTVLLRER
ncbi:MAG: ABC transporter permease [Ruminococcus bromii]|nr:ABC transporter permease [Ruminococcus bromii]MDY4710878.1 ABC transporter permease [Ruminococcus bromii]